MQSCIVMVHRGNLCLLSHRKACYCCSCCCLPRTSWLQAPLWASYWWRQVCFWTYRDAFFTRRLDVSRRTKTLSWHVAYNLFKKLHSNWSLPSGVGEHLHVQDNDGEESEGRLWELKMEQLILYSAFIWLNFFLEFSVSCYKIKYYTCLVLYVPCRAKHIAWSTLVTQKQTASSCSRSWGSGWLLGEKQHCTCCSKLVSCEEGGRNVIDWTC